MTGVNAEIERNVFYQAYADWEESENAGCPLKKKTFAHRITNRGIGTRKSGNARYWTGIVLKP